MLLRRLFYRWQFIAVIALPVWLLVGWAVFGSGGWGTLGLALVVPVAFIALGIIALLVNARPTVRAERATSWLDVAVLGAWHLSIIGTGFYGPGGAWFAVFAVILAIAAFWVSLWQLISDGAKRMKASMDEFERLASQQPGGHAGPVTRDPSTRSDSGDDDGDVIIVREVRD